MKTRRASEFEPLWTPAQTADYLGVPVATLYRWRYLHTGPTAFRVGRHLRYDPAAVRQWLHDEAA
jgi:excisionase family DNA binding protein